VRLPADKSVTNWSVITTEFVTLTVTLFVERAVLRQRSMPFWNKSRNFFWSREPASKAFQKRDHDKLLP